MRIFLKGAISAIIAVTFCSVFLLLGRSIVGNIFGVNENFYLKYYYDLVNGENADRRNYTVPDSLTIINIQNYRNRRDIASIISKVYDLNPKCIGVDVFFGNNSDVSEESNEALLEALKKAQDKLIVSCNYQTNDNGVVNTVFPFFHKEEGLKDIEYASPLACGVYEHYAHDDSLLVKKDSTMLRMSTKIAAKSHMELNDYHGKFYVNYAKKDFAQIIISDTTKIYPLDINGNIVLIGDMSEIKDMTTLPFRFGTKQQISGIEDIAYSLISLLQNKRTSLDAEMRYNGFTDCSDAAKILLTLFLSFIFSLLLFRYSAFKEKFSKRSKFHACFAVSIHPAIVITAEIALILISYLFTFFTNMIPDLFVSIISIALVSFSNEITNIIISDK